MTTGQKQFDCGCVRAVGASLGAWIWPCPTHSRAAARYNPSPIGGMPYNGWKGRS